MNWYRNILCFPKILRRTANMVPSREYASKSMPFVPTRKTCWNPKLNPHLPLKFVPPAPQRDTNASTAPLWCSDSSTCRRENNTHQIVWGVEFTTLCNHIKSVSKIRTDCHKYIHVWLYRTVAFVQSKLPVHKRFRKFVSTIRHMTNYLGL